MSKAKKESLIMNEFEKDFYKGNSFLSNSVIQGRLNSNPDATPAKTNPTPEELLHSYNQLQEKHSALIRNFDSLSHYAKKEKAEYTSLKQAKSEFKQKADDAKSKVTDLEKVIKSLENKLQTN